MVTGGEGEKVRETDRHKNRQTYRQTSGLYYKTITIVIMTIVSDAMIWSITLTIVIMTRLAKARIVNYDRL